MTSRSFLAFYSPPQVPTSLPFKTDDDGVYAGPSSILESDLSALEHGPLMTLEVIADAQHEGEDHDGLKHTQTLVRN